MKKRIAVILAGGTISTYKDKSTRAVFSIQTKEDLSVFMPNIDNECRWSLFTDINTNKYFLTLSDWEDLYNFVKNKFDDFDGFVIAQESDSLIFGASIFFYMFSQCKKPIIFTSSPFPIGTEYVEGNISKENIINAVKFAKSDIGEVCIYDNKTIHRSVRTERNSIVNSSLFNSYQSDPLGEIINNKIILYLQRVHREEGTGIFPYTFPKEKILFIKISPVNSNQIQILIKNREFKTLVIETLGYGSINPNIYAELTLLAEQGVKIILIAKNDTKNRSFKMDSDSQYIKNSILLKNTTIWGSYAKTHIAVANTKTNEEFEKFMKKSFNGDFVE